MFSKTKSAVGRELSRALTALRFRSTALRLSVRYSQKVLWRKRLLFLDAHDLAALVVQFGGAEEAVMLVPLVKFPEGFVQGFVARFVRHPFKFSGWRRGSPCTG